MKKLLLTSRWFLPNLSGLVLVATLGVIAQPTQAAQTNIYKMNTITMNTTNDWSLVNTTNTGTLFPPVVATTNNYICNLTAVLSATNAAAMSLGGNVQMDCLQLGTTLAGPLTITNDGHTLTLGTSINTYYVGIRETAGILYDVSLNCPLQIIGNNQRGPFTVQAGRTLNVNGPLLFGHVVNDAAMLVNGQGGTGTVNLNGGGYADGTYFGCANGILNIQNSNLTVSNNYNWVCGYTTADNELNISNCTVTMVGSASVLIGGGYNGAQITGTGITSVGGTNGAPGVLNIARSGTFKIGVQNGTGAAGSGTLNINNYGTVSTMRALTANTLANSAFINFNGGTLQLTAPQANLIGANFTVTMLDGGATIDTTTNSTAIVPAIVSGGTGIGGLTKNGNATLTLANNSAWGGPTAINAGELKVSTLGFNNASSLVTVAANATNGVTKVAGGSTWSIAGLTYSAGSTYLDLIFNTAAGLTTAPITVNGNLAINGTLNIMVSGSTLWAAGTYPLIKYTGTQTGAGTVPSTPLTLPAGLVAHIVNDTAHKAINLVVTTGNGAPPQVISWDVASGTWDYTTPNWLNSDGNLVNFLDNEATLLNDGAPGTSPNTVQLDSTVNPAGLTVNDTVLNYIVQGSGSITGTNSLIKSGTGTLQMNMANGNTYSGGTYVQSGTFQISAANNLGAPTNKLVIGPNTTATLYASGSEVDIANPVTILTNGNFTIDTLLNLTNGYNSSSLFTGTVNVNGGGTLDLPTNTSVINTCYLGVNNATVQLDGGTLNSYAGFTIGNSPGSIATLTVNSGTFNLTNSLSSYTTNITYTTNLSIITTNIVIGTNYTSGGFTMADSTTVNSTLNINGGAVNMLSTGGQLLLFGNRSSGTINVTGGSLHINADPSIYLGGHPIYSINGALGTLNITGPGQVIIDPSTRPFVVGSKSTAVTIASSTTGIINLFAGGLLQTGRPITGSNTVNSISRLNFSGGTLKAGANSTNFLNNLTSAAIDGNGATIDDGGFNITIAQPLVDLGGGYLIKNGNGTLYLDGTNTYGGPTLVKAGAFGGSGTLAGDLTLTNSAVLAPGDAGTLGTLTVGGNLSFVGNVLIKLNTSLVQSNDLVAVTGLATNNGTGLVIVTNLGPTLAVGNQFYLFSQPVTNGNALTVTGGGATWANNLAVDGSITVLTVIPTVNTNTFTMSNSVSGGNLNLSWPADRLGWRLQVQTNTLSTGLGTNWFTWPGSTTVTNESIPMNAANGSVFYRMVYP